MNHGVRLTLRLLIAFLFCFCLITTEAAAGQQSPDGGEKAGRVPSASADGEEAKPTPAASSAPTVEDRLRTLEQIIERQQREIQALRQIVERKTPESGLASVAESARVEIAPAAPREANQPIAAASETALQADTTQKRVDELYKKFGPISLSGDIRFRTETFANQGFDSLADQPSRVRLRIRARLALDGIINNHLDWGLKLATGAFTDHITTNQTMTDFFERKAFALERMFVRYDSKGEKTGVQLVAGKFEPTFRRTQLVWDDDVNVEGASEALYFKTKSSLKQFKLVAFQLPFDEQSAGKDGVLYGGQAQSDWKLSGKVSANVNLAYYNWVRADRVLQALGAPLTQVNGGISNGAGVSGGQNGALGTSNRLIRNAAGTPIGLLADFHLFDVLSNLTWQAASRLPVTFTFDFVRNLSNRIDDERNGYWGVVQVGQTREKGDWLLGYAFARIEQDAVLVPFNFSDILASNSRVHMPTFAYQVANGVTLQWSGLFSERVNKVIPHSPVNRWQNRMAFDVIYKF